MGPSFPWLTEHSGRELKCEAALTVKCEAALTACAASHVPGNGRVGASRRAPLPAESSFNIVTLHIVSAARAGRRILGALPRPFSPCGDCKMLRGFLGCNRCPAICPNRRWRLD